LNRRIAVSLVLAVVATACGGGGGDRLTVYSGRTQNLIGPLLESFAEETGIGVDVRYGQSADLALLIDQEGENSPADIFISQSPGAVGFLAGRDRLAPISGAILDLVDPRFKSSEGLWVGLSGRIRVLVYNQEMVDPSDLPSSVFDVVDPRYQGQVAVAPTNGSFQDFVTAMRELHGDDVTLEWLEGLVANDSPTYANNTAIVQAVADGEVPMGLVNHYYNYRFQAEDPDTPSRNHIFGGGDVGALLIVTAAGVLDTADNPDHAERLLEYLLSEEAQTFFSQETFEYPLAAEVSPALELPPLSQIETPAYDIRGLGGGLTRTKELIDLSGLESS